LEIPDLFLMLNMISHFFAALTREISLYFINYAKYFNTDNLIAIICKTVMFLEFYVFGERVIGWEWGGVRNISSPLRGGIKYFPTLLGVTYIV
jgi:hypothetical protein